MADTVRGALRDRLSFGAVAFWLVLVGALFWVLDEPLLQIGVSLVTTAILGGVEVLSDAYDLRSECKGFALGVVTLVSASILGVFGDGSVWVPLGLGLAGAWLLCDAGQVLRHEGLKTHETPDRDGHEVYHEYVTREVDEVLRERALTRRELSTALDADDQAIDRALSTLDERGLLSRRGSELQVSSSPKPGPLGRVRSDAGRVARRLARPLTVEFERDADDREDTDHRPVESRSVDSNRERESAGRH